MGNGTLTALGRYCENILPPVHTSFIFTLLVSDAMGNGTLMALGRFCGNIFSNSSYRIYLYLVGE